MSEFFDGTKFVGFDDKVVGDPGASENAPLDTMVDQGFRGNEIYLWEACDPVVFTPYAEHSDSYEEFERIRPFASIGKTTWLTVPWICERGLKGFRVRMYVRVDSPDVADADGVFLSLELQGAGVQKTTRELITVDTGGHFVSDHFEWIFDEQSYAQSYTISERRNSGGLERPVEADLNFNFRSEIGSEQVEVSGIERISDALFDASATLYPSSAGVGGYDTSDLSLCVTKTTDFDGNELHYDHVYSPTQRRMYVREKNNLNIRSAPDADLWTMAYIQIKSLEIQALY